MAEVKRIYPEPKTALINWIEENFERIGSYTFVCTFTDEPDVTQTIHDTKSRVEAFGLFEAGKLSMLDE